MNKVIVLGISDAGPQALPEAARTLIAKATLIVGGERHLGFVKDHKAEKLTLKGNLKEVALRLEQELNKPDSRPLILASGDPLFYGIGRFLAEKLGAEKLQIHPAPSSMQLAFARAGLSWQDADLISVHGREIESLGAARPGSTRLGIFTDAHNDPSACALFLLASGWPTDAKAWVCENLEGADEKVTACALGELPGKKFGELNVVVVDRPAPSSLRTEYLMGLDDALFAQRKPEKGLITRAEIRLLSVSKLRLFPGAKVWDIGAATGSVAIEAARLSRSGRVWAVEKNEEDCANIRENATRFGLPQLKVLHGAAPAVLAQIPEADAPDAVFVGGSSGKMSEILDLCATRLVSGGSIVVNTVTLENGAEALEWYKGSGFDWDCMQVQVSRRKPILDLNRFEALNPVTIFWGTKR
ncbi:MAG: precorrin-6y C5,15-methyltransferase (decarboxylating) subunit CbiE [candidate division FCPU426 bacterium]